LVSQVIKAAVKHGVPLMAENALEGGLWNQDNLDQMLSNSQRFKRWLPNTYCVITEVFGFLRSPDHDVFIDGF
jgi:type III secretion system FlhB-like substrate exporter